MANSISSIVYPSLSYPQQRAVNGGWCREIITKTKLLFTTILFSIISSIGISLEAKTNEMETKPFICIAMTTPYKETQLFVSHKKHKNTIYEVSLLHLLSNPLYKTVIRLIFSSGMILELAWRLMKWKQKAFLQAILCSSAAFSSYEHIYRSHKKWRWTS